MMLKNYVLNGGIMRRKSIDERIKKKKEELDKVRAHVLVLQKRIKKLSAELEELENFEILSLTKGLAIPTTELKSLLEELKNGHVKEDTNLD